MSIDVLLLLGKAPKPGTIIHEVLTALAARGVTTKVARHRCAA